MIILIQDEKHHPDPHTLKKLMMQFSDKCFWCGCICRLFNGEYRILPDNAATIDHFYSNTDKRRIDYRKRKTPSPSVLSCNKCNHDRKDAMPETYAKLYDRNINMEHVYFFEKYV